MNKSGPTLKRSREIASHFRRGFPLASGPRQQGKPPLHHRNAAILLTRRMGRSSHLQPRPRSGCGPLTKVRVGQSFRRKPVRSNVFYRVRQPAVPAKLAQGARWFFPWHFTKPCQEMKEEATGFPPFSIHKPIQVNHLFVPVRFRLGSPPHIGVPPPEPNGRECAPSRQNPRGHHRTR